MKVILDNNIWISFLIGKRMVALQDIFCNAQIRVVCCEELEREFLGVACRPKIRKYVGEGQVERVYRLMSQFCLYDEATPKAAITNRDPKDVYLLALAEHSQADYLVSGDSDLTDLGNHGHTQIVSFQQFMRILGK